MLCHLREIAPHWKPVELVCGFNKSERAPLRTSVGTADDTVLQLRIAGCTVPPSFPNARNLNCSTQCHSHKHEPKTRPIYPTSPAMTKPFATCSLPDLVYELFLDARAAAVPLLPRLADAEATEAALQRHPRVRGASGLVCTSERAWCSMLRDLFSLSGAAVSDADLRRVYLVCRQCCKRGRVRV